jgi:hypothetical protein
MTNPHDATTPEGDELSEILHMIGGFPPNWDMPEDKERFQWAVSVLSKWRDKSVAEALDDVQNIVTNEKKQWLGDQPALRALGYISEAVAALRADSEREYE